MRVCVCTCMNSPYVFPFVFVCPPRLPVCVYGGICQIVAEVKRSHLEDSAQADPSK